MYKVFLKGGTSENQWTKERGGMTKPELIDVDNKLNSYKDNISLKSPLYKKLKLLF